MDPHAAHQYSRSSGLRKILVLLGAGVLFILIAFIGFRAFSERALFTIPPPTPAPAVASPQVSEPVTLLFVGDIMLARNIGAIMSQKNDWDFPFRLIASTTRSADIAFANLEGPLALSGVNQGSIYSFRANPAAVSGLLYAGFDVLSVANNHIWDYGPDAFLQNINILKSAGVNPVGGGSTYADAHSPAIKNIRGTRVAFLAYTKLVPPSRVTAESEPATAYPDIPTMTADIYAAKLDADIVVVSFHWGEEYATLHNREQEELAHAAVDAGASLIIGHHPHVVEETESYHDGFIAYSLGNFVFDQNFSRDTSHGLMVRVKVQNKKIANIEELPVQFTKEYQPFLPED